MVGLAVTVVHGGAGRLLEAMVTLAGPSMDQIHGEKQIGESKNKAPENLSVERDQYRFVGNSGRGREKGLVSASIQGISR